MSVKGTDLSSSRVLDNLMLSRGIAISDGWEKRVWRRTLTLPQKGKKDPVAAQHVRPYLIHTDGTIITVQAKAWMDSAGICMWADVQIGPIFAAKRRKCLIIWDNCGSHNVAAVREVLKEWGLTPKNLPPNMTDILQPMDLVVNGPVKAGIRRARVQNLFNHFQLGRSRGCSILHHPPPHRRHLPRQSLVSPMGCSQRCRCFVRHSRRRCFRHP